MKSAIARRIAQIVISGIVIVFAISNLFLYFANAKKLALDTNKKIEFTQLFHVIEIYYIGENVAPKNPNKENWCVIDEFYDDKKCLLELNRDAYIGALPTSPEENQYYYHNDKEMFIVATRMSGKLNESEKCPYNKEENVWCKYYIK